MKSAPRAAAGASPGVNLELPHAREQDSRVRGIHGDVRAPSVFIDEEDVLPALPAIEGAEDATLRLRAVAVTQRADEDDAGVSGVDGSRGMRPVASSPIRVQVSPASVDLYTPCPIEMWLRIFPSPVPAQTMFGFVGETASEPIDCTGWSSNISSQFTPPSVVLYTPPEADPT